MVSSIQTDDEVEFEGRDVARNDEQGESVVGSVQSSSILYLGQHFQYKDHWMGVFKCSMRISAGNQVL